MRKTVLIVLAMALVPMCAFAVDGVTLINQSTVMAAGGFPYKITQSGSYKLSGNLAVPAGANGIEIDADNVLLDLNGFTVNGPGKCNGVFPQPATSCSGNNNYTEGILTFGLHVTVKNGSVAGMGFGVVGGALVEEVHANNNSQSGIQTGAAIVRRCTADNNGVTGFALNGATVVAEANEASLNGSNGMVAFAGTVIGNTLHHNGFDGLSPRKTVYGSNSIQDNPVDVLLIDSSNVSQNNNICSNGKC